MKRTALLGVAVALSTAHAWADGPVTAYENGAPVRSTLDPGEYVVNSDGAKEDPNHRMSDVARAYRNGLINGRAEQKEADAKQKASVPPIPAVPPEWQHKPLAQDDSAKWTTIPPQPHAPQPPQSGRYGQAPQYAQVPHYAQGPMAYADPMDDDEPPPPQVVVQTFMPPPPPAQPVIVQYIQPGQYAYAYAPPAPAVVQSVISVGAPIYRGGGYWRHRYGYAYGRRMAMRWREW